ncbi:cyanate transporter [Mesorhizobium sp. BAC0120]|uniref:cyanate transporter n=1 Tax=Mesorhizobium sp. BAC0120 TaxID=3090670 RepID=UPI00298C8B2C|nr:cyanate transporter [Mesorhizobium sp. BAC0120]MDW6020318.1 cyanate transporter [Mesorhizobium sp. BAC0120]
MARDDAPFARILLIATVATVALNLRPFITSVGPLAQAMRAETGLGLQGMALLTLVPMILMGLVAFIGPSLQGTFGARRSVIGALTILCVGSFLRLFASAGWAMIATAAMIGFGVAIVQAVFPGTIKREFPKRVGVLMGLYSAMLMGGGALGAQVSPVIADVSGSWHVGLAWLALPALVAVVLAIAFLPGDIRSQADGPSARNFLTRPRTWLLMASFGLVNGGYSSIVAWLAPSFQGRGWSSAASGGLLAVMAACQALAALTLPALASKGEDRRPWLWSTLAMQAAGFAGLAFAPDAAPTAWAALVGVGLGGCFALSLVVALDHLPHPEQAGTLSALMQGGGFLIAAIPPWLVAVLHDVTGSYAAGWLWHLGSVAIVIGLTARLAPNGYARAMSSPDSEDSAVIGRAVHPPGSDLTDAARVCGRASATQIPQFSSAFVCHRSE